MGAKSVTIGSLENVHVFDDGAFDYGFATDSKIKAEEAPTLGPDVLRLDDVGVLAGDVFGPGASTDNAVTRFDGVDGKHIQNSNAILDDIGNLSIGVNELTVGSINRVAGTLSIEVGGLAGISVSNSEILINSGFPFSDFRVSSFFNANLLFVDGGNGAVIIGTNAPINNESFRVNAGGDVVFDGTYAGGATGADVTGSGVRFLYHPETGAIRAGRLDSDHSTYWDLLQLGSAGFGFNVNPGGPGSFVYGYSFSQYDSILTTGAATGGFAGGHASSFSTGGVAKIETSGLGAFSVGMAGRLFANGNAIISASGIGSAALGSAISVDPNDAEILSSGQGSFAVGYCVGGETLEASGDASVCFGSDIQNSGDYSMCFGKGFANAANNSFKVGWAANPTLNIIDDKVGILKAPVTDALEIADGEDIGFDVTNGTIIGTNINQKFSFWSTAPTTRPAALTGQVAGGGLTVTAPGVQDTILNETNAAPWGFATQDEIRSFMEVVENNRLRIADIEDRLQTVGLIA